MDMGAQQFLPQRETFPLRWPSTLKEVTCNSLRKEAGSLHYASTCNPAKVISQTHIIMYLVFKVFITSKRLFFCILEYEQISLVTPILNV